jgi:hypothetical protein
MNKQRRRAKQNIPHYIYIYANERSGIEYRHMRTGLLPKPAGEESSRYAWPGGRAGIRLVPKSSLAHKAEHAVDLETGAQAHG